MALEIVAPSERISAIIADLSRRRATINDVRPKSAHNKVSIRNDYLRNQSLFNLNINLEIFQYRLYM